jgi:hypothetical protein
MKRVIFLTNADFENGHGGGQQRTSALVSALSRLDIALEIVIVSRSRPLEKSNYRRFQAKNVTSLTEFMHDFDLGIDGRLDSKNFSSVVSYILSKLHNNDENFLILDQVWHWPIAREVLSRFESLMLIYSSHNCESEMYYEIMKDYSSEVGQFGKVAIIEKWEREISKLAKAVLSVTEADSKHFSLMGSKNNIVMPNGARSKHQVSSHSCLNNSRDYIYVGSDWLPNVDGLLKCFKRETLNKMQPNAKIHIVGSICDAFSSNLDLINLRESLGKKLVLHHRISEMDLEKLFGLSCVALNPVVLGGGSNIKMAEYLQIGIPVITTEKGLRGFKGFNQNQVFVSTPDHFSSTMLDFDCDFLGARFQDSSHNWENAVSEIVLSRVFE